MMLTTDPPEHTELRRLVSRAFTPRRVADLEPEIRALSTAFLDELVAKGDGDLVADYAARLPMDVIARMLGVPDGDEEQLRDWTNALLDRDEGVPDVTPAGIDGRDASLQVLLRLRGRPARRDRGGQRARRPHGRAVRRRAPAATRSTDEQVVGFLLPADHRGQRDHDEAARATACSRCSASRPSGAKVVADPGRIPDAVEEILRYEGSTQLMARTLTRPVELHGEQMPEGAKVLLLLGSANRDERVWDRPDVFDIDRAVADAARRLRPRHPRVPRRRARAARDAGQPRGDPRASCPATRSTRPAARACTPATCAAGRRVPIRVGVPMSDVDEITALIHEYAFRLDAGDLDGVAALFAHAELRLDAPRPPCCGARPRRARSTTA